MAGESLSWRSAWEALSQKIKALRYEVYKTDKIPIVSLNSPIAGSRHCR